MNEQRVVYSDSRCGNCNKHRSGILYKPVSTVYRAPKVAICQRCLFGGGVRRITEIFPVWNRRDDTPEARIEIVS